MTKSNHAGRIIIFLFVILSALLYPIVTQRSPFPQAPASAAAVEPTSNLFRVLLLPLDSRPPCSDYVVRDARLADIEVILPTKELMDYYTQPGHYKEMRKALLSLASEKKPDAIIISADQLMAGGLLTSRDKLITAAERQETIEFLRLLHKNNPDTPIYVFSILPRLLPPPEITLYEERLAITKYARLEEKAELGEATSEELTELKGLLDFSDPNNYIKPDNLKRYQAIHPTHEKTAKALADLTGEGIITELFIGQDDGEKYGPGNRERRHLKEYFGSSPVLHLVRGADELALSIITRLAVETSGIRPAVNIAYSGSSTGEDFFPYMAASLADTAAEEISLLGLKTVDSELRDEHRQASVTLFIHGGDNTLPAMTARHNAIKMLNERISDGSSEVALVDLSRHFTTEETLLPLLTRCGFPLHRLTSYSGWNTASNSIGTALCEAVLTHIGSRINGAAQKEQTIALSKEILNAHFAEDSIYLKDSIDRINGEFYRRGFFNTGDLDLDRDYRWLTILNDYALKSRSRRLMETAAWRKPYSINGKSLYPQPLKIQQYFPWPRTFEVNTKVN